MATKEETASALEAASWMAEYRSVLMDQEGAHETARQCRVVASALLDLMGVVLAAPSDAHVAQAFIDMAAFETGVADRFRTIHANVDAHRHDVIRDEIVMAGRRVGL